MLSQLCVFIAFGAFHAFGAFASRAPPLVFQVAIEFAGTSPNFHYSSQRWTSDALHTHYDATWQRNEQKTSLFSLITSSVELEMESSDGTTTSVELPLSSPASLESIFSSDTNIETTGSLDEWHALSGNGYQPNWYASSSGSNVRLPGAGAHCTH